ncbi:MAG TPA: TIGR04211 family SH3 domain-containing protein [Gammaproteobacteria bacterium]
MKPIIATVVVLFSLPVFGQPAASVPAGQKAYISDRLILGLYAQPDPAAAPIKSLPSGMQVEILEARDAFVRIRMVDGNEGWARAEFITPEIPAKTQLLQMTRERDLLRQQLDTQSGGQQAQLEQARQKIQRLEQQLANPEGSGEAVEEAQIRYQRAQQKIKELQQQLDQNRSGHKTGENIAPKILWLLATLLLSVSLGAVLGARWLGARVRRRFNGLKVW